VRQKLKGHERSYYCKERSPKAHKVNLHKANFMVSSSLVSTVNES
jgi:hypothetical protein